VDQAEKRRAHSSHLDIKVLIDSTGILMYDANGIPNILTLNEGFERLR